MGVPSFFRWLSTRYPRTIVDVVEAEPHMVEGVAVAPVDGTLPNPNGLEYHALYLDMNGIIHPCFHPEDRPAPTTLLEVFSNVFDYIDRLFLIVRPRRVLFMAMDGVAPRAKMNQQRARRFRAAQDAAEAAAEEARLRAEFEAAGHGPPPPKKPSEAFDSNVITPGTPFMSQLSVALQYYVHLRLNRDPAWRGIKVLLSDSSVPGEGEHKIVQYVRQQRNRPGHDPNTRHCLYGLDADLIMLSLATHEAHFSILRELVVFKGGPGGNNNAQRCFLCNQEGHIAAECTGAAAAQDGEDGDGKPVIAKKPFQFLHIWVLREYLEKDINVPDKDALGFPYDLERIIDDFVFMCFFVGNDFLPHMPTLEIRENAIDLLMAIYRGSLKEMGGYLCNNGDVHLDRVEYFMRKVGVHEEAIFQKRAAQHERSANRARNQKAQRQQRGSDAAPTRMVTVAPVARYDGSRLASASNGSTYNSNNNSSGSGSNKAAAEALKASLLSRTGGGDNAAPQGHIKRLRLDEKGEALDTGAAAEWWDMLKESKDERNRKKNSQAAAEFSLKLKSALNDKADLLDKGYEDDVRLGQSGWKERYYKAKFGFALDEQEKVQDVVKKYIEGLCWVLKYYYQGCVSWGWYYPYYYAPFASDLVGLADLDISFTLGEPFKPFEQLLSVLPAASAHALPPAYRRLMTDRDSSILDFYPLDFEVDMKGKRFAWQGVAKLPFIDEQRLRMAIEPLEHTLTPDERRRNRHMSDLLYLHSSDKLAPYVYSLYDTFEHLEDGPERRAACIELDPEASQSLLGAIYLCEGGSSASVLRSPLAGFEDITANRVLVAVYRNPSTQPHVARLQPGAILPERILTDLDTPELPVLWHEDRFGNNRSPSPYGRGGGGPGSRSPSPTPYNPAVTLANGAHRMLQHNLGALPQRPGMATAQFAQGPSAGQPGFSGGRGRGGVLPAPLHGQYGQPMQPPPYGYGMPGASQPPLYDQYHDRSMQRPQQDRYAWQGAGSPLPYGPVPPSIPNAGYPLLQPQQQHPHQQFQHQQQRPGFARPPPHAGIGSNNYYNALSRPPQQGPHYPQGRR
eukprot:jgi/Chlat1/1176/Chrsp113S01640